MRDPTYVRYLAVPRHTPTAVTASSTCVPTPRTSRTIAKYQAVTRGTPTRAPCESTSKPPHTSNLGAKRERPPHSNLGSCENQSVRTHLHLSRLGVQTRLPHNNIGASKITHPHLNSLGASRTMYLHLNNLGVRTRPPYSNPGVSKTKHLPFSRLGN